MVLWYQGTNPGPVPTYIKYVDYFAQATGVTFPSPAGAWKGAHGLLERATAAGVAMTPEPRGLHLRVLLHSAIEMAARLGLTSVAEGMETLEDWALLRRYGCNMGQGWLIGKAMPAAELPAWLRQHRQRLPTLRAARTTAPVTEHGALR